VNKGAKPPATPEPAPAPATTPDAHDDHGHDHDHPEPATAATSPAAHDNAHDDAHDPDHDHAHQFEMAADDTIDLKLPKEDWVLSAVLVRSRGGPSALGLLYNYRVIDNRASAVNPATVMREFFDTFFRGSTVVLLTIALLVSIVASVGILVSIYNSVSARMREIAILRALGATRRKILLLICVEAGLIGLVGGVMGLLVGHALGAGGSFFLRRLLGEGIDYVTVGWDELLYLLIVLAIAVVAGLVPAWKAYRVPVATHLVTE
jgi:putative ABC transport system permease protein